MSAIALATLLVVVATGCGKSASPEEKWASSVCTTFGDWKDQMQNSVDGIRTQLQSPQQGMLTTIQSEAQSALDATNKLASELKSLPPLNNDQGVQAKQELDTFATQAQTAVNEAKTTLANLSATDGIAQIAQALAPLGSKLTSLATQASTTLSSVQEAGSSVRQGFQDADSCEQFRR